MKRIILFIVFLTILSAGVCFAQDANKSAKKATPSKTITTEQKKLPAPFKTPPAKAEKFPAVVEAKNHAILSAQRSGLLVKITVDAGAKVKKGQLLAQIYYEDVIIEKEGYKSQKKYWDGQAANLTNLNKSGLAPDMEAKKAVMEKNVITSKVKMTDNLVNRSKIYAPYSGMIVRRHVRPHEWVQPGDPVVEIYNAETIYVTANIPVKTTNKFKKGQKNSFFIQAINKNIEGILESFEPMVNVHSNTIKINWKISKPEQKDQESFLYIMPGMKGTMTIE
ncbi:MAG: efflux RND transporter periplasmic adaptor subunit [Deltaproteobacteria bacterium]|nr:efflux RND transporter periplasmic adaptor subunit [Deltaproteobacteria bacterium]